MVSINQRRQSIEIINLTLTTEDSSDQPPPIIGVKVDNKQKDYDIIT